jgi:hypothetical protein
MRVWKFEVIFDWFNIELNLLFCDKLFAKIKQNGRSNRVVELLDWKYVCQKSTLHKVCPEPPVHVCLWREATYPGGIAGASKTANTLRLRPLYLKSMRHSYWSVVCRSLAGLRSFGWGGGGEECCNYWESNPNHPASCCILHSLSRSLVSYRSPCQSGFELGCSLLHMLESECLCSEFNSENSGSWDSPLYMHNLNSEFHWLDSV